MKLIKDLSIGSNYEDPIIHYYDGDKWLMSAEVNGGSMKFISQNHHTDITLAYFLFRILRRLEICEWYEFECLSYPSVQSRVMDIGVGYVKLTNCESINDKSSDLLVEVNIDHSIDIAKLFQASIDIYKEDYDFVPNLYVYRYKHGDGYITDKSNVKEPITEGIYNDIVYQKMGLKRGDVCDTELVNKYLEKMLKNIDTESVEVE